MRRGWVQHVGVLVGVATLIVGCSSTSEPAATSSSTSSPPSSSTVPPNALEITSATWDHGRFDLSDGTPTEDWGVVAAPKSGGPYPVAVVLHGNHPTCPTDTGEGRTWPCPTGTEFPNQNGLTYLVDALAARGFVAIAPGINAQYTLGSGEPAPAVRTAEIAAHAVSQLDNGQLGVSPQLIDADRLVLIGHSVGGQDSVLMATGQTSFRTPVAGLVLLQPALNAADALPLADVPSAVVISECDGDTGVVGGRYVAGSLRSTRTTPAALVVLEGANHNFTNTMLGPDWFPVEAPGCADDKVLDAPTQQALLAGIVPELAHAVLGDGGGAGWAGSVFDDPTPPSGVQLGVVNANEPVAPVPGSGPTVPSPVQLQSMTATFCPEGYYTPLMKPGTEPCHRPELPLFVGLPQTLAMSWTKSRASFTVPVDVAAGQSIVVRVVPDVADATLSGDSLRLHLSTPEGASADWDIPIPAGTREEIPPFTLTHALVMWSTATIDAPQGATAVTIEVRSPTSGSLQVLSVGAG